MKKTIVTLIIACLLLFSSLFPAFAFSDAVFEDAEQVAAVILHTNDAHVAFQDNIGYDGLALYKKELEAVYDHVLLIDAGDAIQGGPIGSVSKGAELIRMMNRLGYDLAVPGNHEFDYGLEALDNCAEALDCGYTCANFCVTGGEPVFQPWRMLEAGDLKIGFVGAVTPDTFTKSTIKEILNEAGEPMYDFLADETGDRLVIKYLEEYLGGVIPEDYREAQGRILMTSFILDPIAAEDIYETDDSVVMSMDSLRPTEEVTPEDIAYTMTYIEKTKKGEMKKREPLSVVERGDGTYSIIDGNKSFSALKELGAKNVPVIIASGPYHKDVKTFDDLMALYLEAEAEFHQLAASLGEELKAEISEHSDLTDADAIHKKAIENYGGDYGKVVDVLSADLRVPADQLQAVARKLLEKDNVLCLYTHEEDNAYTAYIRLSNGAIAELRLM